MVAVRVFFFVVAVAQHHGNYKLQHLVGRRILRGEGLGETRNSTHSYETFQDLTSVVPNYAIHYIIFSMTIFDNPHVQGAQGLL